ncbi:hypothetical protein [Thermoflavimicrobium daqui]|jgi:hypothetical protein|uniref:Uncharacterized protein n=1 Tax=Thermoflavimicrobium daqui TaxID=2137476 RepID=A0A364K6P6_9BACL|nr:hypothetical protein [Thermoflavimicrobium daqui]RAL25964.1 hypothetical protein DL897_07815 [Thermoflavimicrobium daqui]
MISILSTDKTVYEGGEFVYRAVDLKDIHEKLKTTALPKRIFKIQELVVLNEEEWIQFTSDLLEDYPFLKGSGGTYINSTGVIDYVW